MPFELINDRDLSLEWHLARGGLQEAFSDVEERYFVYGGCALNPGGGLDELIRAHQAARLLGILGLTITEESIQLDANLRAHLGAIMQLAPMVFVADQLSVEWSLHYGLRAKLAEHPAWLAPRAQCEDFFERLIDPAHVSNIGEAIVCAILGEPFFIEARHPWGHTNSAKYQPIARFAELMTWPLETEFPAVSSEFVEQRRRGAREVVTTMLVQSQRKPMNTAADVLSAAGLISAPVPAPSRQPRRLVVGTTFDPRVHYSPEYYGGGAGLVYTAPDGSEQLYHGPAPDWDGYERVLDVLEFLREQREMKLLDVGCGGGGFVRRARKRGWDATGVDISELAGGQEHLIQGDVLNVELREQLKQSGPYYLITCFDFWEHIWENDVPVLLAALHDLLPISGLMVNIICTRGKGEQDWTINPGDTFTKENSWLLCSGHVLIRRWSWWASKFRDAGFAFRNDTAYIFQVARDEDPAFATVDSWRPKNLLVVSR